jgi:hypothetical protein
MTPIFGSPVPIELQKTPHAREFLTSIQRIRNVEDWLAERGEFELSGDFVTRQ